MPVAPTGERRKKERKKDESYQEESNRRPGIVLGRLQAATAAMPPASPGVAEREKSRRVTVTKKEAEKRRKERKREGERHGEQRDRTAKGEDEREREIEERGHHAARGTLLRVYGSGMRLLRGGPGCSRSSDHVEDREQPAFADDTETGRLPLSSPARTERVNNIARSIITLTLEPRSQGERGMQRDARTELRERERRRRRRREEREESTERLEDDDTKSSSHVKVSG
ncbi:hypothetical protein DBV15_08575 [Temnothorax longispinosus]|uniref:Uncharacterized protein n=1 Tax=Temnothorax longispinosus TaxID=300112 RepID=A0A4S2KYU3_9HYME|nr:hypothetical protein DBV15_08575 [Temnothorax longispinosus]